MNEELLKAMMSLTKISVKVYSEAELIEYLEQKFKECYAFGIDKGKNIGFQDAVKFMEERK